MERNELKYGAWTHYDSSWLSEEQCDKLFVWLCSHLDWEVRSIFALGKEVKQPRLMSWCGNIPYRYSGQTLEPRLIPEPLSELQSQLSILCDTPFNHIVLNRYRDGRDHMSLHADNEPELGRNPVIAAVSLGATRTLRIVPKHKRGQRKLSQNIVLENGSLLIMGGRMQHTWRHSVPKNKDTNERINITFRYLKGKPGWREQTDWFN